MKPIFLAVTTLLAAMPAHAATATTDCSAQRSELESLRARVRTLEATLLSAAPAQPNDTVLPGTAAKPAARATVVVEEPYSRTGCSRGLFKGVAAAAWQDAELWSELEKGQSPAQVEKLLGVQHYDEQGGDNVIWHFGKCGASSRAQVLFTNGKLADWRAPSG